MMAMRFATGVAQVTVTQKLKSSGLWGLAVLLLCGAASLAVAQEDSVALPDWLSRQLTWPSEADIQKHSCEVHPELRVHCTEWLRKFLSADILPEDIDAELLPMHEWGLIGPVAEQSPLCDIFLLEIDTDLYRIQIQEAPTNVLIGVRLKQVPDGQDSKALMLGVAERVLSKPLQLASSELERITLHPLGSHPSVASIMWLPPEVIANERITEDGQRIFAISGVKAAEIGTHGVNALTDGQHVWFRISKAGKGPSMGSPYRPRFQLPQETDEAKDLLPEEYEQFLKRLRAIEPGDTATVSAVKDAFKVLPKHPKLSVMKDRLLHAGFVALWRAGTVASQDYLEQLANDPDHPDYFARVTEAAGEVLAPGQMSAYCLRQLGASSEEPDASPERTMVLVRHLPSGLDRHTVNAVAKVIAYSRDPNVRAAGHRALARFMADTDGGRADITRILQQQLATDDPDMRATAARGLGATGDVRLVRNMAPLLDDPAPQVRAAVVIAICQLLAWDAPDPHKRAEEETAEALTTRLALVIDALEALDAASKQSIP